MEGIWYMAVYKDKNKNTWYVSKRYTDWDGSKKRLFKRGFQTKREALEYELSFVSRISDNQKMLFKDFIPIYFEDLEKRVRKNTMITKKNIIEIKIRPYFDELRLCDITPKEVMRWQNQMLDGKKKNGKSYAGDTLIKMHAQLSAILNHACKYYGLRTNAAAQTGCFKVKTKKEQQFWTLDEYRKFVDAVSDKTLSYICFEVLFWCGLRLGELRALTKKDIDLVNQTIQIDKSLQIIEGETVITDPKTEMSIRTIDLPDFLCDELKNYMDHLYKVNEDDLLFPVSKSYLHHEMLRGCKLSGVKVIRIHDLRHSHITMLIENGYSAKDVGSRAGHSAERITFKYAHAYAEKGKEMANTLSDLERGEK